MNQPTDAAASRAADQQRSRLAQALETIGRLRTMVEDQRAALHAPIAVIGVGCRFPGGADSPERMWDLLRDGVDAIGPFPRDRWDTDPYYDPDPEAPAKAYVVEGGFLDSADTFDAQLFGIAPGEALGMDPQQRIALEVAWEALERAGIPHDSLDGSRTGVYIGASTSDYVRLRQQYGDPAAIDGYQLLGENSFIAGRVAHTFGLRGPAQVVDTACSSSLVAVHQACQSLRLGETDLALAGGVNVILSPYGFVLVSKAGAVSPDARCKAFDASADGYARGEGCGLVVLKRLSDAQADGDRVLAVIRGSAINHDGHASGISVPSGKAQQDVIRAALADAGVAPERVGYIEAHGTGTALGDPIELRSLEGVLGAGRTSQQPVHVGSVKTNVGHLEAAAGIAGLIKCVLAVGHGEIPASLHFRTPNPNIDWAALHLRVAAEHTPWPSDGQPRIAGLSSFGASGTNAHLVIEEAPAVPLPDASQETPHRQAEVLVASARSEPALRELTLRWADFLRANPATPLDAVARTIAAGRSPQQIRAPFTARDTAGLADRLHAFGTGDGGPAPRRAQAAHRARTAFMFTGQGAQFAGMGSELSAAEPVFRQALERCAEIADPLLGRPLLDILHPDGDDGGSIDRTVHTQPALFAVEYALAELWASWGVRPAAVIGHSVGEYAAAVVAGAVDVADALTLIALRAKLMESVTEPGAMLAVSLDAAAAREAIGQARADRVAVAAVNGPRDTVLSGAADAIAAIRDELARDGVTVKPLTVSHAFHSPLLDPVLAPLEEAAARITVREPRIPLISNLTGRPLDRATLADPGYWVRHARQPVRFHDGLLALRETGVGAFVEIGPGRTLLGLAARTLPDPDLLWLPSLRRGVPEAEQALESLGALHAWGAPVDWTAVHPAGADRHVPLPTYAFQRLPLRFPLADDTSPVLPGPGGAASAGQADDHPQYTVEWRRSPRAGRAADPAGRTLLFADTTGVAERLARELSALGGESVLVRIVDEPGGEAGGWTVPAGDPAALRRLLAEVGPVDRIVHLAALDAPAGDKTGDDDLARARVTGPETVVHLLQALAERDPEASTGSGPTRLWLVTRGAQATGEEEAPDGLSGALLTGLAKVAGLEHADLWGGAIDLDPAGDPEGGAAELAEELLLGDEDDEVAYRGGARLVPRLTRSLPPADDAPTLRVDTEGTYLITGGLGGLGLTLAEWLAGLGARHLVLTGRAGLPPRESWDDPDLPAAAAERVAAVRTLEERGARVTVAAADVCDEAGMSAVLAGIAATGQPLRGVIHAAGLAGAQNIAEADAESLHEVLRPKVEGAWTLHRLLDGTELDFLLLMSSIASVWGSAHLGAYASANRFLDALAAYRRRTGRTALSVSWGPWRVASGLGGDDLMARLEALGLRAIDPETGLAHLGPLLASDTAHAVVSGADWATLGPLLESRRARPLLTEVRVDAGQDADRGPSEHLTAVLAAPADEREALLDVYVRTVLADHLGVALAEITDDISLLDLGLDSLGVTQVIARYRADLALRLEPRPFFEEPAVHWARLLTAEVARQH
ncbi:epothilone polyketide synthase D [Actinacidiphila alni]|uniref:Epothilone polyketide synthase D n=1 Tax=Actinacidiphila alni TaxID=380248 RepID=A0A1I2IKP7_9ACTN|nr:type I polyketide synthase [Actinacidiphila alni]SFF41436.1 epothilone polyketide synthase D [Actinacidiphila alni]